MTIQVTKEVKEKVTTTVELETPSYRKIGEQYMVKILDGACITVISRDGKGEIDIQTGGIVPTIIGHWIDSPEATEAEFTNLFNEAKAKIDKAMSTAIIVSPIPGADAILAEAFKDDHRREERENKSYWEEEFYGTGGEGIE